MSYPYSTNSSQSNQNNRYFQAPAKNGYQAPSYMGLQQQPYPSGPTSTYGYGPQNGNNMYGSQQAHKSSATQGNIYANSSSQPYPQVSSTYPAVSAPQNGMNPYQNNTAPRENIYPGAKANYPSNYQQITQSSYPKKASMTQMPASNQRHGLSPVSNQTGVNGATKAPQVPSYLTQSYGYPYGVPSGFSNVQPPTQTPIFAQSNFQSRVKAEKAKTSFNSSNNSTRSFNNSKNSFNSNGRYFNSYKNSSGGSSRFNNSKKPKAPANLTQYKCDICNATCEGAQSLSAHMKGKSHLKTVKNLEMKKTASRDINYWCEICSCQSSNVDAFKNHIDGKQHKQKIHFLKKNNKPVPNVVCPDVPVKSAEKTVESKPISAVGENFVKMDPSKKATNEYYWCSLCSCGFSAQVTATSHCKGRKHKTNYMQKVDKNYKPDISMADPRAQKKPASPNGSSLNISSFNTSRKSRKPSNTQPHVAFFSSNGFNKQMDAFLDYESQIILNDEEIGSVENGFMVVRHLLINTKDRLSSQKSSLQISAIVPYGNFNEKTFITIDKLVKFAIIVDKTPKPEDVKSLFTSIKAVLAKSSSSSSSLVLSSTDLEENCIYLKSKAPSSFEVSYKVSILPKNYYSAPEKPDEWEKLTESKYLDLTKEIKQSQWCEATICSSNVACQVLRVLRSLFDETEELKPLGCWNLQVILDIATQCYFSELGQISSAPQINPGGLMRFFFELLASGIALPSNLNQKIADPLMSAADKHIFADMKPDVLESITKCAQKMLNYIALNQIDKVLQVE